MCGKPSSFLAELLLGRNELDASRTCMVGDRVSTDIAWAQTAGVDSILVLSGVTSVASVAQACEEAGAQPTYVMPWFGLLLGGAK